MYAPTSANPRENSNMAQALLSPTVQRSLPDLAGLNDTFGFDTFLASPPPTITSDPRAVREHIRGYAVQLERHERFTDIWKHQYENQLVNLRQLITTFDTRCKELEHSILSRSTTKYDHDGTLLGLPEFEDLYYFLACKTRTLYSDLQLRFISNFLAMDDVLHCRGSSSYARANCTVRDVRNFLRAVWFHLLHPVIVRTIGASINLRKYQVLKANPLLPSWNPEDLTPNECERMEKYKLGLNLDASTVCSMFEHLDDVSTMSVPALLMKVSQRGLGVQSAPSEHHMSSQNFNDGSIQVVSNTWIDLDDEEADYIEEQIHQAESQHEHNLGRYHHRRSRSDDPRAMAGNSRRNSAQRASLLPRYQVKASEEGRGQHWGSSTDSQVGKWLPNILTESPRTPHPLSPISASSGTRRRVPPSLNTARKTPYSLPSTPSGYRMPFHGSTEFPHDPPTPPPKSPSQEARAREHETQAKMQRLQRDNSRLQDALQQVQVLQRENSQLQERLSQPPPPRGLFRRLSKARSRSPAKLPRRSMANFAVV